jgi:uncharacterized glyoxalase superfamily protein PhnB
MSVRPIPEGYHAVTPYLVCDELPRVLEFLEAGLGAAVTERMPGPDGEVTHAEVQVGDSRVMLGAARGETRAQPGMLYLYVEDADAAWKRAVDAGGEVVQEPADQFYGDRVGAVADPGGNSWWFATRKGDLTREELAARAAEAGKA